MAALENESTTCVGPLKASCGFGVLKQTEDINLAVKPGTLRSHRMGSRGVELGDRGHARGRTAQPRNPPADLGLGRQGLAVQETVAALVPPLRVTT